jgi:hypothetical protein
MKTNNAIKPAAALLTVGMSLLMPFTLEVVSLLPAFRTP